MTFGDKVICVSGAIRDYVREHYRVPEEKLVVIPRGVDLEAFDPGRLDRAFMARFRQEYGLDGRCVVTAASGGSPSSRTTRPSSTPWSWPAGSFPRCSG